MAGEGKLRALFFSGAVMTKIKYVIPGVVLTVGAAFYFLYASSANREKPPVGTEAPATAPAASLPGGVWQSANGEATAQPVKQEKLTPAEEKKLTDWLVDRGYPKTEQTHDGSAKPLASDYDAMSEQTLRQLAAQNDRQAHLILARRALDNLRVSKASEDTVQQAMEHLRQTTIHGYTVGLANMSEIMVYRAQKTGFPQKASNAYDRELLVEAYKYAYLGQRLGDLNSEGQMQSLQAMEKLSAAEAQSAQQKAEQAFRDLNEERRKLNLPPLTPGMPADIQGLLQRAMANPTS